MKLAAMLFSQGFGTRRQCAGLVQQGRVRVHEQVVDDPEAEFEPAALQFQVDGER